MAPVSRRPGNVSATVKAYFALKLVGYSPDEEFMIKAKCWVHENGGAETVNVFTRITLAMFGQLNWKTVPAMPVEIMFRQTGGFLISTESLTGLGV